VIEPTAIVKELRCHGSLHGSRQLGWMLVWREARFRRARARATDTPEERRRHDMRPRVTGWAAVNGRDALMFDDRLQPDVWYVDHRRLRLDIKIIALTAGQVLRRTDVSTTRDLGEVGFRLPCAGGVRVHGPNAGFGRASGPSNLRAELRSSGFDVDGTRTVSVSQTLGEHAGSSPQ
jgi:hypothetical protein